MEEAAADSVANPAWWGKVQDGGVFKARWVTNTYARVSSNKNGMTGWCKVVTTICGGVQQTFDRSMLDGEEVRVHRCAHIPCSADYPASKYGMQGRPLHVQPFVPAPVLEALEMFSPDAVAPHHDLADIAVAELDIHPAIAELELDTEGLSAPVVEDLPMLLPGLQPLPLLVALCVDVAPLVLEDGLLPVALVPFDAIAQVESPGAVALRCVPAAQPQPSGENTFPVLRERATLTSASEEKGLDAQPGEQKLGLLSEILLLARELRQQKHYVGYLFFILLGMSHNILPVAWEGANKVDLLAAFAPWAINEDVRSCGVEAVCCCFEETDEAAVMCHVSERHPLHMCKHYVAAVAVPSEDALGGTSIESYYHRHGVALLGTVMDGDC